MSEENSEKSTKISVPSIGTEANVAITEISDQFHIETTPKEFGRYAKKFFYTTTHEHSNTADSELLTSNAEQSTETSNSLFDASNQVQEETTVAKSEDSLTQFIYSTSVEPSNTEAPLVNETNIGNPTEMPMQVMYSQAFDKSTERIVPFVTKENNDQST